MAALGQLRESPLALKPKVVESEQPAMEAGAFLRDYSSSFGLPNTLQMLLDSAKGYGTKLEGQHKQLLPPMAADHIGIDRLQFLLETIKAAARDVQRSAVVRPAASQVGAGLFNLLLS